MRVAVEKLDGVSDAEVSLEEGWVRIALEPHNTLTVAAIRETIRDQGFSPRDAEVRVAARVEESETGLVSRTPALTFRTVAADDVLARLRSAIGTVVVLTGRVPGDEGAGGPLELHVQGIGDP